MQPQFILATLLAGLVAAAPQDIVFPDAEDDGCEQGKAITGPPGTFCIGTHGENYGPPKTAATECGIPVRKRAFFFVQRGSLKSRMMTGARDKERQPIANDLLASLGLLQVPRLREVCQGSGRL